LGTNGVVGSNVTNPLLLFGGADCAAAAPAEKTNANASKKAFRLPNIIRETFLIIRPPQDLNGGFILAFFINTDLVYNCFQYLTIPGNLAAWTDCINAALLSSIERKFAE
jgi:hypothetical protein